MCYIYHFERVLNLSSSRDSSPYFLVHLPRVTCLISVLSYLLAVEITCNFMSCLCICRSITAKDFLTTVRSYLQEHEKASPMLLGVITCQRHDTVKDIILKLDSNKIQRIYVINNEGHLEGVITLRDIISRLVHEPRGYFGDFFDGVVPLPQNSRV